LPKIYDNQTANSAAAKTLAEVTFIPALEPEFAVPVEVEVEPADVDEAVVEPDLVAVAALAMLDAAALAALSTLVC